MVLITDKMGPFATVTWHKFRLAGGEQIMHPGTYQTKHKREIILFKVSWFWIPHRVACFPAWRTLYHLTASKGPLNMLNKLMKIRYLFMMP